MAAAQPQGYKTSIDSRIQSIEDPKDGFLPSPSLSLSLLGDYTSLVRQRLRVTTLDDIYIQQNIEELASSVSLFPW